MSLTKMAGSGAGAVSQRCGSADPDPGPYQNVTDPQHCILYSKIKVELRPSNVAASRQLE
jgi:hypothetical protein